MKSRRDSTSPWGTRLYFEEAEFETITQELLRRTGDDYFTPGSGVDVDLVLLRSYKTEADYVDLPPEMMGRTIFDPDGKSVIQISRLLADRAEDDVLARRRLRTTLAHEIGHVCCHPQLFFRDESALNLFESEGQDAKGILCREEAIGDMGYHGKWWEYQANRCMASLLMPRDLIISQLSVTLKRQSFDSMKGSILAGSARKVIGELSDCFDVSGQALFYRLNDLGVIPRAAQRELAGGV